MKSTLEYLLARRSVPAANMVAPGPSADELHQILTVGSRVPDHGKLAPWRFIVFEGDGAKRASAELFAIYESRNPSPAPAVLDMEKTRLTRAPLVIGVVSTAAPHGKIPKWEQELSAGASCMLLIAACNALGYAAQWLSEWYCFDAEAGQALGLVENERFAGFIHIGTPSVTPTERPRPDLDQIVTYF